VLAAVSKREYADIIQDAVHFARFRLPSGSVKDVTALAMDRAVSYYPKPMTIQIDRF
jgi:hypothetical protein